MYYMLYYVHYIVHKNSSATTHDTNITSMLLQCYFLKITEAEQKEHEITKVVLIFTCLIAFNFLLVSSSLLPSIESFLLIMCLTLEGKKKRQTYFNVHISLLKQI